MSINRPIIAQDIIKTVEEIQKHTGWSMSRSINYLIAMGLERLSQTPEFKDLNIPKFDVDSPTRKLISPLDIHEDNGIIDPNETLAKQNTKANEASILKTQDEIEQLFKSIPNYDKIPYASTQVIKMRMAYPIEIQDYDGEYVYDMFSLNKEGILKKIKSNLKWHWNEEKMPQIPKREENFV